MTESLIYFTFSLGLILGGSLTAALLWLFRLKCPQCKELKPLSEIVLIQWKTRTITGQPCQKCQATPPQIVFF